MACKTVTEQIGEHEYSVTQWSAQKAILTKLKLIKTFGAALSLLVGQGMEEGADESDALSNSLSILFKQSSPEDILSLMTDCVIGVACDGKRITNSSFEELFSGDDLLEVYKVFAFVMRVNYGNLMKGQLAGKLLTRVQESL